MPARLRVGLMACSVAVMAAGCISVTRVSVGPGGSQGTCQSRNASLSGDGRFIAFESCSSFVTPEGNAQSDIFVRDRQTNTTMLASVKFGGTGTGDCFSRNPAMANGGRYVAFTSCDTDLIASDTNDVTDVFVRDLVGNATDRVSISSAGVAGNGQSEHASISSDGRYVVFDSVATNLVPGDTNGKRDVFVRDRTTGSTTRISLRIGGSQADEDSSSPVITPDGRYIAFLSEDGLVGGDDPAFFTNGYRYDRTTGALVAGSCWGATCPANADRATAVELSDDGRYLAYAGLFQVWRRDLSTGSTELASTGPNGEASTSADSPAISADGQTVAFASTAANLVADDTNNTADVFLRSFTASSTTRVSLTAGGVQVPGASTDPSMADLPRYLAFDSSDGTVVTGDTNGVEDVFFRDAGE